MLKPPIMPAPTEILDRLQKYLSVTVTQQTLALSCGTSDGRVNSLENERQISQALGFYAASNEWFQEHKLELKVSEARHWYDFAVHRKDGVFIPVNVKVSTLETADNISSKKGVFYALTGVLPEEVNISTWERFSEELANRFCPTPIADYYFLVVGKKHPNEVFWTSLKNINVLVANGNNPPFQCNWGINRIRTNRSDIEAGKYILKILRETFRLRAEALRSFDQHLTRHL